MLPDRSLLIWQKLMENAKIEKLEMRLFGWFSNTVLLMSWQESDSKSVSNPHNGQDYLKSKRTVLWLWTSHSLVACQKGWQNLMKWKVWKIVRKISDEKLVKMLQFCTFSCRQVTTLIPRKNCRKKLVEKSRENGGIFAVFSFWPLWYHEKKGWQLTKCNEMTNEILG